MLRTPLLRYFLTFILGLAFIGGPISVAAQQDRDTVRKAVEKFCDFDFNGAQDFEQRRELIYFSDSRIQELEKVMGGLSPYVFEWEASPLEVVSSYQLGEVTLSGNEAKASIRYEIIARRSSWGGNIRQVPKHIVNARLQLRQDGQQWKIIDPPFPRVSKKFLSLSYRGLFELPQMWYQNASKAQLSRLRDAIDNIVLLDELK